MTGPFRVIDDAVIEAAIERRAPGRADRQLLADVIAAVAATPQVRRPILPVGIRGRRETWLLVAAAALITALLFSVIGGGSDQPSLVPTPSGSASPPASPSPVPTATFDPIFDRPCATETSAVASGTAMPETTIKPAVMSEGAIDKGVYLTQAHSSRTAFVWSVTSGVASRIASVSGSDFNRAVVTDLSSDGRMALLQVGEIHGGIPGPECDDLYLVMTDGSGVERLTFNGSWQHAADGRFSFDGRYVAYSSSGFLDMPPLYVLDLEGDRVPHEIDCSGGDQAFAYAWAPTDDRLAAQCQDRIELITGQRTSVTADAPSLAGGGWTEHLGWADANTILLVVADDGATINGPMRLFSADTAALADSGGTDPWRGPLTITPLLYDAGGVPALPDPTGAAIALFATESESQPYVWYVVDVATGSARQVSADSGDGAVGWSADGGSLLLAHYAYAPDSIELVIVDVASGARRTVGTLPIEYWNGIWHGG